MLLANWLILLLRRWFFVRLSSYYWWFEIDSSYTVCCERWSKLNWSRILGVYLWFYKIDGVSQSAISDEFLEGDLCFIFGGVSSSDCIVGGRDGSPIGRALGVSCSYFCCGGSYNLLMPWVIVREAMGLVKLVEGVARLTSVLPKQITPFGVHLSALLIRLTSNVGTVPSLLALFLAVYGAARPEVEINIFLFLL